MNTRERLTSRLDQAWLEFLGSYFGLGDRELLKPGVIGGWSIKDIIAHVTTWEEETLKHMPHMLQGRRPPRYSVTFGGIDAFNAMKTGEKKDLSLAETLRQQDVVHRELLQLIQTIPEEHLGSGTRIRNRLRLDTYSHYRKHAAAIRKWRKKTASQRGFHDKR